MAKPKPAVAIPPSNDWAPSKPLAIPSNMRIDPVPLSPAMTNADVISRIPAIKSADTIVGRVRDLFIEVATRLEMPLPVKCLPLDFSPDGCANPHSYCCSDLRRTRQRHQHHQSRIHPPRRRS